MKYGDNTVGKLNFQFLPPNEGLKIEKSWEQDDDVS